MEAFKEKKVIRTVIPVAGGDSDIPNEKDVIFIKLKPITNDTISNPRPDYFDGARLKDIDRGVKNHLASTIIPTGYPQDPVLPNFFLEAKSPKEMRTWHKDRRVTTVQSGPAPCTACKTTANTIPLAMATPIPLALPPRMASLKCTLTIPRSRPRRGGGPSTT